jgi:hypothetical protein
MPLFGRFCANVPTDPGLRNSGQHRPRDASLDLGSFDSWARPNHMPLSAFTICLNCLFCLHTPRIKTFQTLVHSPIELAQMIAQGADSFKDCSKVAKNAGSARISWVSGFPLSRARRGRATTPRSVHVEAADDRYRGRWIKLRLSRLALAES